MKSLQDLKNIPEINVPLEKQIMDILMGHKGNAFTISGIIYELTGGFKIEMFSKISPVNTIESFDQYSNIFEFYALVFLALENLARSDPRIKTKVILQDLMPVKFYWGEE